MSDTDAGDTLLGIHHINLSVTHLDTSVRWYMEVLGLEKGWEMDDVEGRGKKVALLMPGSSFRLVLTQHSGNHGNDFSEFATGPRSCCVCRA